MKEKEMGQFDFKEFKYTPEGNWFKRTFTTAYLKKTLLYIALGILGTLVYYYITEARQLDAFNAEEFVRRIFFGAILGFMISHSPCASGKC